jgi:ribosomal protein S13
MARIAGVDLPPKKGRDRAHLHLRHRPDPFALAAATGRASISKRRSRDLTEDEVNRVRQILEEEGAVEGDLRKEISMNIKRHRDGLVPRAAAPPRPAGAGPAHAHQRAHAQGTAPRHGGQQEEGDVEDVKRRAMAKAPAKAKARRRASRRRKSASSIRASCISRRRSTTPS